MKNNQITKIPLKIINLQDQGYHITINCKYKEHDNLLILIDTGASSSVFDIDNLVFEDIEKHNLPEEIVSSGFNSNIENIQMGVIENLNMDGYLATINPALFTSLEHVNALYESLNIEPLAGILGCDFFNLYSAIISFKDSYLSIMH